MALIHPRVAQNFIKAGYFPTDEVTLERILSALHTDAASVRIFDPCCGEGVALAEVKHHLSELGAQVDSIAIEFDQERARHAKTLLDRVLHADMNDTFISARSTSLLFLNPPYGYTVADKEGTGDRLKSDRLEKMFWRKTIGSLAVDGVVTLIVPYTVFFFFFFFFFTTHIRDISIWMAPEQQFKQTVLFGYKRKVSSSDAEMFKRLMAIGQGELPPTLPEQWTLAPYLVPENVEMDRFTFVSYRINGSELSDELNRFAGSTLWSSFNERFNQAKVTHPAPLRTLSTWHLALALAAGQINGFVKSKDNRTLLIKGNTIKEKRSEVIKEVKEDESITETLVMTDVFIPTIKAIDFTEGSGAFGSFLTIK